MNANQSAYEACFKKKLYWTEDEARDAANGAYGRHGVLLDVYPCLIGNHGEHFHIGHHSARAEANRRLRTFGSTTLLTR